MLDDDSNQSADICRVCRSEGLPERPLFHPCICTGSIKFIHQECLLQWMRYSRKEYCELCGHRFSFTPIYSPDMPRRLPLKDVAAGLLSSIATAVKQWCHYTLVAGAWLGVVPLTACRIYRCLFTGSVHSVLTLPLDLLSMENLAADVLQGCLVVTCTLFAFLGLVWLREQILHGGGPDWLEQDAPEAPLPAPQVVAPEQAEDQPAQQVAEQPLVGNGEGDGEEAEEGGANWNPIEWNGAAEELTWERLLGLDGSLVFLEHVFWVVSLNTLFVLVFAFCPYHIGHFVVMGLRLGRFTSHFEGLVTTLTGYCVIGIALVVLHAIASLFHLTKSCRVLGLCYIVVKVSVLCVVEVGVLPLICGWWLDICSLAMFDATLKDRELSFSLAPGTSLFIHWLVGMVYVYYFASFVLLLREVVRPGVLWFVRNLNDPDFSPIQEMIHISVAKHVRRLLLSVVIFGTAVLLMLWLPTHLLRALFPGFLPYVVTLTSSPLPPATTSSPPHFLTSAAKSVLTAETAVSTTPAPQPEPTHGSELSLELLLLQVVLPALLEQSHTRAWLKAAVRGWCAAVAWLLGLRSYLLGDNPSDSQKTEQEEDEEEQDEQPLNLGEAHQAHQAIASPQVGAGQEPFLKPRWFAARVTGLLVCLACSLVIASLCALTIPVWIGRRVLALAWAGRPEQPALIHELYTAATGTYLCWAAARAAALLTAWAPRGRAAVGRSLKRKIGTTCRALVAAVLLLGVVPLLFGTLLECVVVVPLRVPLHQTPVLCAWHDWALGVLYTKIACAVTLMGPNWWLKAALERAYRDGLRDLNLSRVLTELAMPVIMGFGLALAVPYILSQSVAQLMVNNPNTQVLIERRIYPFLLLAALTIGAGVFQVRQFRRLYEHIKNDKYLVGRRLVNYDHQARLRRSQ